MTIDLTNTTFSHSSEEENERAGAELAGFIPDNAAERAAQALRVIYTYGTIDGEHHKTWVLDQAVRILTGERYGDLLEAYDKNTLDTFAHGFGWDEGTAP